MSPNDPDIANDIQYIIISGNVVDGLNFWGPFDDFNTAENYASYNLNDEQWSITELTKQEE